MPKAYDPKSVEAPIFAVVDGRPLLRAEAGPGRGAPLHGRHPAAKRHGLAPHGPRAQQHHPGRGDPPRAHDRSPHPLGARHRSRGHRDPEQGRADARQAGQEPPRRGPRGVHREVLGVASPSTARPSSASSRRWAARATTPTSGSRWTRATRRRSARSSSTGTTRGSSTGASASSTGARAVPPRSRTSRSSTRTSTATCGTSATRSPSRSAAATTWWWPPRARDDARRHVRGRAPG
jgi:hypothetical protein